MPTPTGDPDGKVSELVWCDHPDGIASDDTPAAFIGSLDDPALADLLRLAPTSLDEHDRGQRRGIEGERFLARRALLRHTIGRRLGLDPAAVSIGYDAGGRPVLRAPATPLWCSVTARRNHVGIALAATPVGIDLEPVEPGLIPWTVLTAAERDRIAGLPPHEQAGAFLRVWTLKEAYVKARGTGFANAPEQMEIGVSETGIALVDGGTRVQAVSVRTRLLERRGTMLQAACVVLPSPET